MKGEGSINLNLNREDKNSEVNLSGKVHQLPCCIKYNGPCIVSDYFRPKSTGIEVDGLRVEEAHFRGRKMHGVTVSLPNGYSGFVLGKKSLGKRKVSDMSEENSNCWEMKAKFDNLTHWNHDTYPSKEDAFLRSFHWFAIAEALHEPVTAEDFVCNSYSEEKLIQAGLPNSEPLT